MLSGAMYKGCVQAVLFRGLEIVLVSCHQHDLLGFEIEEVRNQQIDLAVRLVVANVLGGKNAVPGETGMLAMFVSKEMLPLESVVMTNSFFSRARPATESGQGFKRCDAYKFRSILFCRI